MTTQAFLSRVWPSGTMVVLCHIKDPTNPPQGSCGQIIKTPDSPTGTYLIRFADGTEHNLEAPQLEVLKHYQGPVHESPATEDLHQYVQYSCVIGSRAYGLDHAQSDVDLRGFFLPPADLQWSLWGVPEQIDKPGEDLQFWELEKFIKLALKANPNVLECLYSPLVKQCSPLAQELLDMRHIFLSKMVYQTYHRYVLSQFQKLKRGLERGTPNYKHAMHLIRLMLSGLTCLREGFVQLRVDEHKADLLEIKAGQWSWDRIDAWRVALHAEFDKALANTQLPERPDYARANDFLIKARRQAAAWGPEDGKVS